jgi:hypothetical protein
MKLLIIALLASPVLLSAHESYEQTCDSAATKLSALKANEGYKTYMEATLSTVKVPATLLRFLMHTQSVPLACENVGKLLLTLKQSANDISEDEVVHAASLIGDLYGNSRAFNQNGFRFFEPWNSDGTCRPSLTEPMLYFAGLAIPAARDWLDKKKPEVISKIMGDFKRAKTFGGIVGYYNVRPDLVLAILKFKPELARDQKILTQAIRANDKALLTYLVNHPAVKNLFIPKALSRAFPLSDPDKAEVLVKAFGAGTLMSASPRDIRYIWPQVLAVIMKESLDNKDDFFTVLDAIFLDDQWGLTDSLLAGILDVRNDKGETVLMKYIEYLEKYTTPFLIEHSAYILNYLIRHTDVNAAHQQGETALIQATRNGEIVAVQLLIEQGAHLSHRDEWGNRAQDYAQGNPALEQFFDQLGKQAK